MVDEACTILSPSISVSGSDPNASSGLSAINSGPVTLRYAHDTPNSDSASLIISARPRNGKYDTVQSTGSAGMAGERGASGSAGVSAAAGAAAGASAEAGAGASAPPSVAGRAAAASAGSLELSAGATAGLAAAASACRDWTTLTVNPCGFVGFGGFFPIGFLYPMIGDGMIAAPGAGAVNWNGFLWSYFCLICGRASSAS
mmetsp:Transcript_23401/g.61250  ORF Transcript_23401/g.61250 Transcript_23401/m.61250 type:complete len:201 (+) Transcript_23401:500-1102(+)